MNSTLCLGSLCVYLLVTLAIGSWTRRFAASSNSFLYANRSLPAAVVVLSFLVANTGALEAVGLCAMAAQYGVQAFHFYWIGAAPAMVVCALWFMPLYRQSGVLSTPEWLELRYGPRMRLLNACVLLVMLPLFAGIGLYASALLLEVLTGTSFVTGTIAAAVVVLGYTLLGGIRATMYTEVLQLGVMLAGLGPLAVIASMRLRLLPHLEQGLKTHLWQGLPAMQPSSTMDVLGVTVGLGFVLSFSYWCTDFVLMQRAFSARTDEAAQRVPLIAGFGKLVFSLMVVIPGLVAARVVPGLGNTLRFDQAMPALMRQSYTMKGYGPVLLALGFTAITASLTSALSANVMACSALWTSDVYRRYLAPACDDRHYLRVGRAAMVAATLLSLAASFLSFHFGDLMEQVQLIFSTFGSPFWAIFLLGFLTRRVNERGALLGFVSGASVAMLHYVAFASGWLIYGSNMTANFYAAIYSFTIATMVAWWSGGRGGASTQARVLSVGWSDVRALRHSPGVWTLAALLLAACAALNYVWR